jgi:purine-nucleoside phosphorylase
MQAAVNYIRSKTSREPRVAVVLGSGLGAFAEALSDRIEIPYAAIPDWPVSTAISHAGNLVFGNLNGFEIAVMAGRSHLYEGYSPAQVTMGVRVLHRLGVRSIIFTNAAGGINLSYSEGALVLISDHINLQGSNPLMGPNDDSAGPRFPDMTDAYSAAYRAVAHQVAGELGIPLSEGVYAALTGPSYETPAEIRYLRTIGADLVGMSTVPEAIVANHLGMRVLAISCVTNMAAGIADRAIDHGDVLAVGERAQSQIAALLGAVIPRIAAGER